MLWYNNDVNPAIYSISNGVSVCVCMSQVYKYGVTSFHTKPIY